MATWLFCQLQQLCAVAEVLCNTLCLYRCRVTLVKRPEMVPAVHKQRSREQVRAIEYARFGELQRK
jgi:hypothetical protein